MISKNKIYKKLINCFCNLSIFIKRKIFKVSKIYKSSFFKKIKNKNIVNKIFLNLKTDNDKIIYFHHDWGGGSEVYVQNKIEQLRQYKCIFVLVYKSKLKKFSIEVIFKGESGSLIFNRSQEVVNFFKKIQINDIFVSQITSFPTIDIAFDLIDKISTKETLITMLVHDFYSICKSIHLLKSDGDICGLISNNRQCDCSSEAENNIKHWENFLVNKVDDVVCFSNHSQKIISRFYTLITGKIQVVPHQVSFLRKVSVVKSSSIINIAVLGFLNKIKGMDLIEDAARIIDENSLPIRIVVVGEFKTKKINKSLKIIGKYKRNELPDLIEENEIDLVFISSICPETFSYTTHESIMMGLKVACFNLGAQAEYVSKYDKGLVISKIDANIALNEIIKFVINIK
jgi:glycosyltransferase involved in cell wall biosynthesis